MLLRWQRVMLNLACGIGFVSKIRQLFRRLFKINYTARDIESMINDSKINLYNQAKPKAVDYADKAAEDYLEAITAWHGTGSNFNKFSTKQDW